MFYSDFFFFEKNIPWIKAINTNYHVGVDGLDEVVDAGAEAAGRLENLTELTRAMLARIAELNEGLKQVSDNIAHDLKTPLALIQLFAETLELGRVRSTDRAQEYYRNAYGMPVSKQKVSVLLELTPPAVAQVCRPHPIMPEQPAASHELAGRIGVAAGSNVWTTAGTGPTSACGS